MIMAYPAPPGRLFTVYITCKDINQHLYVVWPRSLTQKINHERTAIALNRPTYHFVRSDKKTVGLYDFKIYQIKDDKKCNATIIRISFHFHCAPNRCERGHFTSGIKEIRTRRTFATTRHTLHTHIRHWYILSYIFSLHAIRHNTNFFTCIEQSRVGEYFH